MDPNQAVPTEPIQPPVVPENKPKSFLSKPLLLGITVILLLTLFLGGYFVLNKNKKVAEVVPTATPTPTDETANWKTYENQDYGYSIKYPKELTLKIASKTGGIISSEVLIGDEIQKTSFIGAHGISNFEVIVYQNKNSQSIQEWLDERVKGAQIAQKYEFKEDLFVDGNPARRYSMFEFDKQGEIIISSKNNYFYYIHFPESDPNDPDFAKNKIIYQKMLSTFKFTNSDETANWKTYTSPTYNPFYNQQQLQEEINRQKTIPGGDPNNYTLQNVQFSLSYPPDWTASYVSEGFIFNKSGFEIKISKYSAPGGNSCSNIPGRLKTLDKIDSFKPLLLLQDLTVKNEAYFWVCSREDNPGYQQVSSLGAITLTLPKDYTKKDLGLAEKILSTFKFTQ